VTRFSMSALLGLLMLGCAACGSGGGASGGATDTLVTSEEPAEGDVSVQVISHAFRDSTIYIFLGSSKQRLGIARGNQTTVFNIPWARFRQANEARLSADPIGMTDPGGGRLDVGSDRFTVRPGNTVVWTLQTTAGKVGEFEEAGGQSNVVVY
jgi:hypothetical protein